MSKEDLQNNNQIEILGKNEQLPVASIESTENPKEFAEKILRKIDEDINLFPNTQNEIENIEKSVALNNQTLKDEVKNEFHLDNKLALLDEEAKESKTEASNKITEFINKFVEKGKKSIRKTIIIGALGLSTLSAFSQEKPQLVDDGKVKIENTSPVEITDTKDFRLLLRLELLYENKSNINTRNQFDSDPGFKKLKIITDNKEISALIKSGDLKLGYEGATIARVDVYKYEDGQIVYLPEYELPNIIDKTPYGPDFISNPETEGTNFSSEKLNEQKKFLIDWTRNRKLSDPENQNQIDQVKDSKINLIKNMFIVSVDSFLSDESVMAKKVSDVHVSFNKAYINIKETSIPLHEFNHIIDEKEDSNINFILPFEIKIMEENILSMDDYIKKYNSNAMMYVVTGGQPTELRSRIMQIRYTMNFKPDQKISDDDINNIFQKYGKGELKDEDGIISLLKIVKDKNSLKNLLNGLQ